MRMYRPSAHHTSTTSAAASQTALVTFVYETHLHHFFGRVVPRRASRRIVRVCQ